MKVVYDIKKCHVMLQHISTFHCWFPDAHSSILNPKNPKQETPKPKPAFPRIICRLPPYQMTCRHLNLNSNLNSSAWPTGPWQVVKFLSAPKSQNKLCGVGILSSNSNAEIEDSCEFISTLIHHRHSTESLNFVFMRVWRSWHQSSEH